MWACHEITHPRPSAALTEESSKVIGGSAVFMLVQFAVPPERHFRLSSGRLIADLYFYLSSMPWSCMTSTVGMASDLDTYACLSFGLAQLQLMRISIQCGGTPIQFVRSFPSLLAITPRRIRADAAVKAAEISLPVAIIPPLDPHPQPTRHHCAVTASLRLDITFPDSCRRCTPPFYRSSLTLRINVPLFSK